MANAEFLPAFGKLADIPRAKLFSGQTVSQNADVAFITGAVQSNFVRLAAAGAN